MSHYRWLTPAAPAAVAVLRCPRRAALIDRDPPAPGCVRLAALLDAERRAVDEVLVCAVDDSELELCTHGGPGIRRAVDRAMAGHGLEVDSGGGDDRWARLARAPSPAARDWLLAAGDDAQPPFPACFLERHPLVLITGPSNAGKSSLLNAWCGHRRALVSTEAGTTRDLVAAEALADGWRLRLVDSAGLREGGDTVERAGQDLVAQLRERADCVVHLSPADAPAPAMAGAVAVSGKVDLLDQRPDAGLPWAAPAYVGEEEAARMLAPIQRAVLDRLGLP